MPTAAIGGAVGWEGMTTEPGITRTRREQITPEKKSSFWKESNLMM